MRLELNLPALERLIGGDTELELHLRYQVVEAFAKNHLKAIVNSAAFSSMAKEWRTQIDAAVRDEVGRVFNAGVGNLEDSANYSVRHAIRGAVKKAVEAEVENVLAEVVKKAEDNLKFIVKRAVKNVVTDEVTTQVRAEVKRRLEVVGKSIMG